VEPGRKGRVGKTGGRGIKARAPAVAGNRCAGKGKAKGNKSSEGDAERQKVFDRARDVIGEVGIQVCWEIYREMEEAKQEACHERRASWRRGTANGRRRRSGN